MTACCSLGVHANFRWYTIFVWVNLLIVACGIYGKECAVTTALQYGILVASVPSGTTVSTCGKPLLQCRPTHKVAMAAVEAATMTHT